MSVAIQDGTEAHDEGYFASFTDLLVGVLFIFIILLMVFANNFSSATDKLTGMTESRDKVLKEIEHSLKEQGVQVKIDTEQGILRLPESILFESGKYELNTQGIKALDKLAGVLQRYLPCLATMKEPQADIEKACEALHLKSRDGLETLLIEGHTDLTGNHATNWMLSAMRGISVFQQLTSAQPVLDQGIVNVLGVPVLAVSGYEARRPVKQANIECATDNCRANRRIDLRFIIRSPSPEDVKRLQHTVR